MSPEPSLSGVAALISGKKEDLRRCLGALHAQTLSLPLEIIVPYDDPCAEVATLRSDFPAVTFVRAEGLDTWAARAGASHEHHDALRTIGIRAASGDVIALTEDHAYVASREMDYPEIALEDLREIAEALADVSTVEQAPQMEGRTMLVVLAPVKGVAKKKEKTDQSPAETEAEV